MSTQPTAAGDDGNGFVTTAAINGNEHRSSASMVAVLELDGMIALSPPHLNPSHLFDATNSSIQPPAAGDDGNGFVTATTILGNEHRSSASMVAVLEMIALSPSHLNPADVSDATFSSMQPPTAGCQWDE